ncbi:MAG: hypothetical protein AAF371_17110 [Pseudomonadota bacterium]
MTEMTGMTANPQAMRWLRDPGPRKLPLAYCGPTRGGVDARAFARALVAAPLIVAVVGLPLVIPLVAMVIGLPAYLLAGGPVFWLTLKALHRSGRPVTAKRLAVAGFVANLFTPVVMALVLGVFAGPLLIALNAGDFLARITLVGAVFAPLLGAVFGSSYARSTRG